MDKGRVEAFSDGVMAIILTIMVLELSVPEQATWDALQPLIPKFLSYILSFIFIGIYWNNHHHLWQAVRRINGCRAAQVPSSGTCSSSTMIVMMMAITPSLKASTRPLSTGILLVH